MPALTKKDFSSNQEVRWCPGCGDYAILAAMQRFLPTTGLKPENIVFVSGIGCAGRFPYYMNSYGFHTIHGRGPAVATGIKMMNPELSVWLITGDGDGLSIGANHLLHALRRNIDINVLLFNNQIYGLTKGQFSPTSHRGQRTKTSPGGLTEAPLEPLRMALAANATFVARGIDKDPKHLISLFDAANKHRGTAFIEIYQNCHIFNEDAFSAYDDKTKRQSSVLFLEQAKPMLFGSDNEYCLSSVKGELVINSGDPKLAIKHQLNDINRAAQLLSLPRDSFPLPLGIIYQQERACFSTENKSIKASEKQLQNLLNS